MLLAASDMGQSYWPTQVGMYEQLKLIVKPWRTPGNTIPTKTYIINAWT